jgi:hypothetical protein
LQPSARHHKARRRVRLATRISIFQEGHDANAVMSKKGWAITIILIAFNPIIYWPTALFDG